MKKKTLKLTLRKETVSILSKHQHGAVNGGGPTTISQGVDCNPKTVTTTVGQSIQAQCPVQSAYPLCIFSLYPGCPPPHYTIPGVGFC